MLYVAETDGDGRIACIWVTKQPGDLPRPYDPMLHGVEIDVAQSQFSGANARDIKSWIEARVANINIAAETRQMRVGAS